VHDSTLTSIRMMRPLCLSIVIATTVLQLSACDAGTREETAAALARDSSLSHDLQLATGDTAAAAGLDTKQPTSVPPMVEGRGSVGSTSARVVANEGSGNTAAGTTIVTESPGAIGPVARTIETPPAASAAPAKNAKSVDAEDYAGPSCASPALTDQRRCLLSYLARSDAGLDKTYQSLITALKREAGTSSREREPPTVLRLRTAQRNWLVYRDDECRRRNEGKEGPLWAPTRAQCLAEYSEQRTRELASALATRSAAAAATKPVAKSAASKSTSTKRAVATKRTRNRRG
jgi:uncharacterized protein YecT (DUF1311 family)